MKTDPGQKLQPVLQPKEENKIEEVEEDDDEMIDQQQQYYKLSLEIAEAAELKLEEEKMELEKLIVEKVLEAEKVK